MGIALKVKKKDAQKALGLIKEFGILDTSRKAVKEGEYVYFPLTRKETLPVGVIVEKELPKKERKPHSIVEALKEMGVPEEVIEKVPRSFDIIGTVAVLELPEEAKPFEKLIGDAILRVHPNVKTVAVEEGPHQGTFRVQPVRVIAGERNLLTLHKEHGVKMWVKVGEVYFSVRHSFERKRIAEEVKPGEVVAALFAGVGPYPLVIAKKQPQVKKIYAVELNPVAYNLMVRNVELNRFEKKIIPVLGDVRDIVPRMFPHMADRVIMPLPKSAEDFLDVAITALKPQGGIIHFYTFGPAEDPFSRAEKRIVEVATDFGYDVEFLTERKVADYAPYVWKVVVDAKLTKSK